ncbi:hypothetical protein WKV44_09980 [Spirochaetia bacterium 38H-sp]|uniref:Uncharacterized protein n=1 Tax=Rarispira pelagica TaxID=3141764 RepID=A0ABU9UDW9_9SPIR
MQTAYRERNNTETLLAADSFADITDILGEIRDPLLISKTTYLDDKHPLRKDAILIMDAIASITNGILDNSLIQELYKIEKNSPFYSWQQFTLALYYIYKTNTIKARECIQNIDKKSPLKIMIPILTALTEDKDCEAEEEKKFLNHICQDTGLIKDIFIETERALEDDRVQEAEQFACLLIQELNKIDRTHTEKTAIALILEFDKRDYNAEIFTDTLHHIIGKKETKRLLALAYLEENPEISLMAWMQYTIIMLKEESIHENTINILKIIHTLLEFINNNIPNTNFVNAYLTYLKEINAILSIDYPKLCFSSSEEFSLIEWEKKLRQVLGIKKSVKLKKDITKKKSHTKTEQLEFDF